MSTIRLSFVLPWVSLVCTASWRRVVGALLCLGLDALPAHAQDVFTPSLSFCNKTETAVRVAVGFDRVDSQQSTTKGWYKVAPCACRTVLQNTPLKATEVFVLANRGGFGNLLSDPSGNMCVRAGGFVLNGENANPQTCQAVGGQWVPFKWFDTGGRRYRVNLRRAGQCGTID